MNTIERSAILARPAADDGPLTFDFQATGAARWSPWRIVRIKVDNGFATVELARPPSNIELEKARESLRVLARAIRHVLADHGFLRPLLVCLADPDERGGLEAELRKWQDDQDWHRGQFVFRVKKPEGLSADIEGIASASVEADEEAVAKPKELRLLDTLPRSDLWARVREWVAERNVGGAPKASVSDAERVALRERIRDWARNTAPLPVTEATGDVPVLVLASFSKDEAPPRMSDIEVVGRVYLEQSTPPEARGDWDERVRLELNALRDRLKSARRHELVVQPKCTAALAIRAGAVFHASSGIQLAPVQLNRQTGADEVWRKPISVGSISLLVDRRAPSDDVSEVQLRVGVTQDVGRDADAWTAAHGGIAPLVLNVSPPTRGDAAIPDAASAWGFADELRRLLLETIQAMPKRVPIRVFYSGPTALAVCIGTQLNALGTFVLMDWFKGALEPTYVVSFEFAAGT